jgi:hypothetical protein
MKRNTDLWQLMGFATTSLIGTLLHFLYTWLEKPRWIAPFASVNESTFEHMKLLFWPMLLFALIEGLFLKDREDFWCIKARGTLLGLVLIPVIFYTYNGAVGKSPGWINIAIFFIAAAAAYIYEAVMLRKPPSSRNERICKAILMALAAAFVIFTFKAPGINLFLDPISKTYGI